MKNCSTANLSGVSPASASRDSRACNPIFPHFRLRVHIEIVEPALPESPKVPFILGELQRQLLPRNLTPFSPHFARHTLFQNLKPPGRSQPFRLADQQVLIF